MNEEHMYELPGQGGGSQVIGSLTVALDRARALRQAAEKDEQAASDPYQHPVPMGGTPGQSGSDVASLPDDSAADSMARRQSPYDGHLTSSTIDFKARAHTRASNASTPHIPARGQQQTRQNQDHSKDWLLGEKDFSPKIMKELLGYTASLGLTTSYQC
jgi:hypothetical protein